VRNEPPAHLLEKLDFVELIVGPAHVKHTGCPLLGNHIPHELAIVMKVKAPRKVVYATVVEFLNLCKN
jgi:hypothetical protein